MTSEGGWSKEPRRRGRAADGRRASAELVEALNESLQIAGSTTHDVEQVPQQAAAKPRRRASRAPQFPLDPRETMLRRAVAALVFCGAALAVGWLVARLFG
jgi:hypothetical protein